MTIQLRACIDQQVRAGSARWRKVRKTGIGASEIAQALGIAPRNWGGPYSLYMQKTGELPDDHDNAAMEWGRDLESTILKRFLKCHPEFREGPCVTGKLYRSKEREWQLATPDAVVVDLRPSFFHDDSSKERVTIHKDGRIRYGLPVVVQVKTANSKDGWGREGTDEIPVYYRAQVLQEMDVVGARIAWVPILFAGRDYREYYVERHARDITILRARGADFWRRVQRHDPPPVDNSPATTRSLKLMDLAPEEVAVVDAALLDKLARAKRLKKKIDALVDGYTNQVRVTVGEAQIGVSDGRECVRRTRYTQRAFDIEGFREDHPYLADEYTSLEPRERFNIYPPKE